MIRFTDGPAAGKALMLKRSPVFLRVVYDRKAKAWDALDQLDDKPGETEEVYVYVRTESLGVCHVRATRGSGFYPIANYRLYHDQPLQVLRDQALWREWCQGEVQRNRAAGEPPKDKGTTNG